MVTYLYMIFPAHLDILQHVVTVLDSFLLYISLHNTINATFARYTGKFEEFRGLKMARPHQNNQPYDSTLLS